MIHNLKCAPEFFEPLRTGLKTAELRKDDRGFAVGDVLLLREWSYEQARVFYSRNINNYERMEELQQASTPHGYTGREVRRMVTHIVRGGEWLTEGFVMLSLAPTETPIERALQILRAYTHELGHAPPLPVFLGRAIADVLRGRPLNAREQLNNLADAMVEDILNTPDAEILAEYIEDGGDPEQLEKEMRAILEKAIVMSKEQS